MSNETGKKAAEGKMILSMLIFGTIGIFRRYIPVSSAALAMSRGFLGMLFLLLVLAVSRRKPDWAAIRRCGLKLLISGFMLGLNWILLFEAYNYTTVAVATLCYYMAPIFVILASPLVVREKLSRRKIFCVALALAGMVLISGVLGAEEQRISFMGLGLGLGAAVLYASIVFLNKKLTDIPAYDKTLGQLGAAALVLLPYVLIKGDAGFAELDIKGIVLLIFVGIVHTGLAYALYFGALEKVPAQTSALISYIDPVSAILLSALFLKEPMTVTEIIGAVLILTAAVLCDRADA